MRSGGLISRLPDSAAEEHEGTLPRRVGRDKQGQPMPGPDQVQRSGPFRTPYVEYRPAEAGGFMRLAPKRIAAFSGTTPVLPNQRLLAVRPRPTDSFGSEAGTAAAARPGRARSPAAPRRPGPPQPVRHPTWPCRWWRGSTADLAKARWWQAVLLPRHPAPQRHAPCVGPYVSGSRASSLRLSRPTAGTRCQPKSQPLNRKCRTSPSLTS